MGRIEALPVIDQIAKGGKIQAHMGQSLYQPVVELKGHDGIIDHFGNVLAVGPDGFFLLAVF